MSSPLKITIMMQDLASAGLKKIQEQLGLTHTNAQKVGSSLMGMVKSFALSTAAGIGLYNTVSQLAGRVVDFVKTSYTLSSSMEQSAIAFETMLGSAEAAGKMLKDLKDFAATTPFEFMELQGAAKRMMAYGFAADEVLPKLTIIGDAAAALGGGSEMIGRITLALGQMQAKGKVSGEELRQLSEAGIPALKYLADAAGMTTAEFTDFQKKGIVPAKEALDALLQGMKGDFGGLMAAQTATAAGQVSMLKDEVSYLQIALGDTFRDEILKSTQFIIAMVKELRLWAEEAGRKAEVRGNLADMVASDVVSLEEMQVLLDKVSASKRMAAAGTWKEGFVNLFDGLNNNLNKWTMTTETETPFSRAQQNDENYGANGKRNIALAIGQQLQATEEGRELLLNLIKRKDEEQKAYEDQVASDRREDLKYAYEQVAADEIVRIDTTGKTLKQKLKADKEFLKELEGIHADSIAIFKGTIGQTLDAQKKNAEDIMAIEKSLREATRSYSGMGAARSKATTDIATTRALLLGEIDALTGLGNKTDVYTRSLGELDTKHREILGVIHALQDKQKAGTILTAEETETLLKAGQARNDLMPALEQMVGWTEAEADRKTTLHDKNAAIQGDIDDLIASTIESGETTDKDREKLAKWKEQLDLNNASLLDNGVASKTAKADTDLLTGSYDTNYKKLDDLIKSQGGNATAMDTQKTKIDELQAKLAELKHQEELLTEGVITESRRRIVYRELEIMAKDTLDQKEIAALKYKMGVFGLQHDEGLNRTIAEEAAATGLAELHNTLNQKYGDNLGIRTIAEREYTRIAGELIQKGIIPDIESLIIMTLNATNQTLGLKEAIINLPPTTVIKIHTVFSSEGKDAADSAPSSSTSSVTIPAGNQGVPTDAAQAAANAARAAAAQAAAAERDKQNKGAGAATTAAVAAQAAAARLRLDLNKDVGGHRATGGSVTKGNSYLVGEHGRELFSPTGNGMVYSNAALGRASKPNGGVVMNIANITITGVQDVQAMYRALEKEAKARSKKLAV